MANPNAYECEACGATFDSKEQLDGHNRRQHPSGSQMTGAGTEGRSGKEWGGRDYPNQGGGKSGTAS